MGYQVDESVRNHLISREYPNYNHSTWHPIGEKAHNPGTAISPSTNPRSHLYVQNHGVYTIEPRVPLPNGISIEEMVVVDTKQWNYTLCPRQTKLILIHTHDQ
jgi:Xaa-Pro aminopeptidase